MAAPHWRAFVLWLRVPPGERPLTYGSLLDPPGNGPPIYGSLLPKFDPPKWPPPPRAGGKFWGGSRRLRRREEKIFRRRRRRKIFFGTLSETRKNVGFFSESKFFWVGPCPNMPKNTYFWRGSSLGVLGGVDFFGPGRPGPPPFGGGPAPPQMGGGPPFFFGGSNYDSAAAI